MRHYQTFSIKYTKINGELVQLDVLIVVAADRDDEITCWQPASLAVSTHLTSRCFISVCTSTLAIDLVCLCWLSWRIIIAYWAMKQARLTF